MVVFQSYQKVTFYKSLASVLKIFQTYVFCLNMSRCLIPSFCFTCVDSANMHFKWIHLSFKHILSTWFRIKLLTFCRLTLNQWWRRKENRGSIVHFSMWDREKKWMVEKLWWQKLLAQKSDSHGVCLKHWARRTDFWFMLQSLEIVNIHLGKFNAWKACTLKN